MQVIYTDLLCFTVMNKDDVFQAPEKIQEL